MFRINEIILFQTNITFLRLDFFPLNHESPIEYVQYKFSASLKFHEKIDKRWRKKMKISTKNIIMLFTYECTIWFSIVLVNSLSSFIF